MILEIAGAILLIAVTAIVFLAAHFFLQLARPSVTVSRYKAALTTGIIQNAAKRAGIDNEKFNGLLERVVNSGSEGFGCYEGSVSKLVEEEAKRCVKEGKEDSTKKDE